MDSNNGLLTTNSRKFEAKVRRGRLGATEAYILWEQTVKAAEVNDILEEIAVFYWIHKWKANH